MVSVNVAIIATVVAAIATTASIWQALLLRSQLRTDDKVRVATFYQGLVNLFIQLDRIFLEKPHLRAYFYENQSAEDPVTRAEARSLAEYLADVAESCTAAEDVLPNLTGDWDDYFNYIYRNSPVLRDYWAQFRHLFPARVNRAFVGPSARPKAWPESASTIDEVPPQGGLTT